MIDSSDIHSIAAIEWTSDSYNAQLPRSFGRMLWTIIAVSLAVHVACLVAGNTLLQDWRWTYYPVHTAVEMSGALIAFGVAWMLISLERRQAGTSFNVWIAGALIGMGLLDALHAMAHAGQEFVWLHSTATFVGGVLFVLVWTPKAWGHRVSCWWPWFVLSAVVVLSIWSLGFSDSTPRMLVANEDGEQVFSHWAEGLNLCGGILLFVAAVRFVTTYVKNKNVDDLLFCLHCSLFGAAGIMFEQSELWDLPWWGWHLLRLLAYLVALWFVAITQSRLVQGISERTKELARANDALAQSNIELQQFAYIASHDLQSPLRGISSFAQFLQQDYRGKIDEQADEYIDTIVDGVARMQRLINDLLAYSRVDSRAKPFQPTDLGEVVDDAVVILGASIKESSAEVTHRDLPTVAGDRSQLAQLFQNLIGNAMKYRAAAPPCIHISAEENGDGWTIGVGDNGIGIEAEHHERIFEIFRRLHTRQEYPGTGIGLAVCRRIVHRHGGKIWVESQPGQGSTFIFTIPARSTS